MPDASNFEDPAGGFVRLSVGTGGGVFHADRRILSEAIERNKQRFSGFSQPR
jgi:hypothetical protein